MWRKYTAFPWVLRTYAYSRKPPRSKHHSFARKRDYRLTSFDYRDRRRRLLHQNLFAQMLEWSWVGEVTIIPSISYGIHLCGASTLRVLGYCVPMLTHVSRHGANITRSLVSELTDSLRLIIWIEEGGFFIKIYSLKCLNGAEFGCKLSY